jgi:acid stress chaperone HdeB
MKRLSALMLASGLWLAAPAAQAQQLDLSTIKCKEFLESGKDTIGLILMWLEGYYSDEDSDPIVDFDKMKQDGTKLGEYCGRNPTHSLITGAEKVMSK